MIVPRRLGVLGGLGPLATADFLRKLILATPVERDQEHIPTIVHCVPQIPDRIAPILTGQGESPLPALVTGLRALEALDVEGIAMPCITAHHWYAELARSTEREFLHIADAVCASLAERSPRPHTVGLLGTEATLASGFLQSRLRGEGFECLVPDRTVLHDLVLPAIGAVKRADTRAAAALAEESVRMMLAGGADTVVLACTELPIALEGTDVALVDRCLDTVDSLARLCVRWALSRI